MLTAKKKKIETKKTLTVVKYELLVGEKKNPRTKTQLPTECRSLAEKEKKKVWDSNYNRLFDLQLGDTQCTRALVAHTAAAAAKSLQSCPTLCDLIDGSSLGSSVPGILQARTLEWVTISFSNA